MEPDKRDGQRLKDVKKEKTSRPRTPPRPRTLPRQLPICGICEINVGIGKPFGARCYVCQDCTDFFVEASLNEDFANLTCTCGRQEKNNIKKAPDNQQDDLTSDREIRKYIHKLEKKLAEGHEMIKNLEKKLN